MPDEPIIDPENTPASKPAEPITEPVIDPTAKPQTTDDPLKLSVEAQSRYKSAADLEMFAKEKQSEADKSRLELEIYRQQHPQPSQPQPSAPPATPGAAAEV